jgi:hypothetical protein
MTEPGDLKASILEMARREPSATRRAASRQTALILAFAVIVNAGLFFLFGGVHRGLRPTHLVLATQGGAGLLALLAVWVAFGRGRSMLGRPRRWLLAVTILTPMALLSWTLFWSARFPEAVLVMPERVGLRCLAFTLALAAWPLSLILRSLREKNPVTAVEAGAARGAAIGAIAWVLVALWCPLNSPAHLALGHFCPLLVLAALGSWLGKRMTGIRTEGPRRPSHRA